jgi:hypothetical protein
MGKSSISMVHSELMAHLNRGKLGVENATHQWEDASGDIANTVLFNPMWHDI